MTFVGFGDDDRHHLPLSTGERRFTVHDIAVKLYGGLQDLRIMPLNADYVGQTTGTLYSGVILLF